MSTGRRKFGRSDYAMRAFACIAVTLLVLVTLEAAVGDVWATPETSRSSPKPIVDTSSGGVEVFGNSTYATISEMGAAQSPPLLDIQPSRMVYLTSYGRYVFENDHPEKASLLTLKEDTLVDQSYFMVDFGGVATEIANVKVTIATKLSIQSNQYRESSQLL